MLVEGVLVAIKRRNCITVKYYLALSFNLNRTEISVLRSSLFSLQCMVILVTFTKCCKPDFQMKLVSKKRDKREFVKSTFRSIAPTRITGTL